jgi:Fe-S-cluster containining protein
MKFPCKECGGLCCGPAPMSYEEMKLILEKYSEKIKMSPHWLSDDIYLLIYSDLTLEEYFGDNLSCIFYSEKRKKCKIYEDRPQICRDYGNKPDLPCGFLFPQPDVYVHNRPLYKRKPFSPYLSPVKYAP